MVPAWVDRREYPFEPRALDLGVGVMRYVDEGTGSPIVMVHGTPTWSFLYRHLITAFRDRFRCVVPDHLGFGLSDKPAGWSYRPEDQARNLEALIGALGLERITLVVHDFGGPIGLAYALDHPDNVERLVLFNTWMWSLADDPRIARASRLLGSPVGRFLYERLGFSARVVWRRALVDTTRYTPAVHRHYVEALRTPAERHATWVYARELLGSSAWYDALWRRRERFVRTPALLVWGTADPAFGGALPRWRQVFADAEVVELAGCGHAPPEERAPEVIPIVARFLARDRREPAARARMDAR